jgi:SAM-dependent methyltransferase
VPAEASGLHFGRAAEDYERGRPEWSEEVLARAADELALAADATVVDVAAGTGKLTRLLVDRFARVIAVEPDPEMRAVLERTVSGTEARAGTAEALPLADECADAVFVGEAFHWFDGPAALTEFARVLRPRGALALLWNQWEAGAFDPPLPASVFDRFREIYERSGRPGGPKYLEGGWRDAFSGSAFEELRQVEFVRELVLDRAQAISFWLSVSSVASLPAAERAELALELDGVLADRYRLPLRTDLYWTRLSPG